MRKGHLLNERYKIKAKIGGGGMADVFLARDIILERDVAVKALRMEYANDQEFIARFDREAQSATSLSNPNIVSIYDVGEEDQLLYMVMEYVDGMTLKEYIQNYGPIQVQEALDIMKQITSAIAHAHANDIVHRDIKPQNILIDNLGQVKVTDFGIAIALSATALTQTNSILGSVHYLSPEQARGGMATKKSDVYSLGIVLFEMLTGRLPFSGQSPVSIALKHLQSETPSVRRFNQDIPQSVENIVLQATAKDPFHRYDTIYELEHAVETALHPDKINESPYSPPVEVGEETKAIPIITENEIKDDFNQETLVHQTNGVTKNYPDNEQDNDVDSKASVKDKKKKTKKQKSKSKKTPKNKRKKWLLILSIIFVLLLASVAALFILPGILQPNDVTIPEEVIEMEVDEATELLESLKLVVEEEEVPSDDIEEGLVTRTNPNVGRIVKEGSTVTLFVSSGKEKVIFDDYVGRDYNQVKRELEVSGFTDFLPIEEFSEEPEGEIISHISPSASSEVIPSETRVSFTVSKGPEPVSLENIRTLSEEEARDYLEKHGLVMNKIEENSDSVEEGHVTRQEPSTGSELHPGDTVDVYISIGPKDLPPNNVRVNATITYEPPQPDDGEDEQSENQESIEQMVRIYIEDMDNPDYSVVYDELTITSDEDVSFTLTIAPGSTAKYRIERDDEVIKEDEILYEEGE